MLPFNSYRPRGAFWCHRWVAVTGLPGTGESTGDDHRLGLKIFFTKPLRMARLIELTIICLVSDFAEAKRGPPARLNRRSTSRQPAMPSPAKHIAVRASLAYHDASVRSMYCEVILPSWSWCRARSLPGIIPVNRLLVLTEGLAV